MRELRLLLVFLMAVFLGGALMAPWLWKLARIAAAHAPAVEGLASQPFHRYVNRCLLVLGLAGLWPLYKAFGIPSPSVHGWSSPWKRPLAAGMLLGAAALPGILAVALLLGDASPNPSFEAGAAARRLASSLATAAVVALLEEWLFRGVIHGALRRSLPFATTAAVTSFLYALVHFFDRPPAPSTVDAFTGLWTLGQMLRGFTHVDALVPGLLNLFGVGWMLALARERSGGLALCMGIHAGWILPIKAQASFISMAPSASPLVWGSHKVFDGWAPSVALALQLVILHLLTRRPARAGAP